MFRCPVCDIPLCMMTYEGVTLRLCPDCRGALVRTDRFEVIQQRREQPWAPHEAEALRQRIASAKPRPEPLRCPKCLLTMDEGPLRVGEGQIRVDACDRCGLYWFDPGELDLAQILFEKERDSRSDEDLDRIERAVVAQMELGDHLAETARDAEETLLRPPGHYLGDSAGVMRSANLVSRLLLGLLR